MLRYMIDTNICIYAIKGRPPVLSQRFDELAEAMCISMITLAELLYGAENSQRRRQNLDVVEEFAARLAVLPFSPAAASHYGEIRAALRRVGQPAGVHDMLIGAHARCEGLVLVTNNLREFRRMSGLNLENWVQ